jgi:hypothetical protein
MSTKPLYLALLLALPALGCGGGNSSAGSLSYVFTAAISGNLSRQIQGVAIYAYKPNSSAPSGLVLQTEDLTFRIVMDYFGGQLETGTYTFESSGKTAAGALADTADGKLRVWFFDGGTLTITSKSSAAIAGSFDATAYEEGSPGSRVKITGSFTAALSPVAQ